MINNNRPYITSGELANYLNCSILGDNNRRIYGIKLYNESSEDCLSYIPYDKISYIPKLKSGVILTQYSIGLQLHRNYIVSKNDPYLYLEKTIRYMIDNGLYGAITNNTSEISSKAELAQSVTIGKGSVIKEGSKLFSGVVIGDNVKIGENCIIGANTVIGDNTVLEDNIIIGACSCIGSENFEYCKNEFEWTKIPVIGGVHIGCNVRIGGNVVIERGTIGTTIIGDNTQIENLVQIGHEVKIGNCCHIVSCVGIAGWAEIGNHVDIYGQAAISNNIKVGDNSILLARTGADKNISEDMIVSGYPAQEHKNELRFQAFLRKLFRDKMKGRV